MFIEPEWLKTFSKLKNFNPWWLQKFRSILKGDRFQIAVVVALLIALQVPDWAILVWLPLCSCWGVKRLGWTLPVLSCAVVPEFYKIGHCKSLRWFVVLIQFVLLHNLLFMFLGCGLFALLTRTHTHPLSHTCAHTHTHPHTHTHWKCKCLSLLRAISFECGSKRASLCKSECRLAHLNTRQEPSVIGIARLLKQECRYSWLAR